MKVIALENITDYQGSIKGFGDKKQGEVFEILDKNRALEIIAMGAIEEVKTKDAPVAIQA